MWEFEIISLPHLELYNMVYKLDEGVPAPQFLLCKCKKILT